MNTINLFSVLFLTKLMSYFRNIFNDSLRRSDMLSCNPTLRFNGQTAYQSNCLGLVSLIIVAAFVIIFVIKFMSVLQFNDITSFEHLADNLQSSQPNQNVMFAMSIQGLSMKQFDKYFQFSVTQVTVTKDSVTSNKTKTQTSITFRPCKIDYWTNMGIQNMDSVFTKRGMSGYYCPTDTFTIQGTSDDDVWIYSEIRLNQCGSIPSPFCKDEATRLAYYQEYLSENRYFVVKLFIRDTIISPTQKVATTNYLQRDILLSFTNRTGSVGYVKLADFEINTDTNILPWNQYQQTNGYFIQSFQISVVPLVTQFINIRLQKSTKKLTVDRQYGKIDDLLSYVGGLFGLLFFCIQFFIGSFNQYRYQLAVGEVLFDYDDKKSKAKQQDLHFVNYMIYSIYDWLSFFGCAPKSWNKMRKIHQTREQACQQMDIKYLLKKIRFLENIVDLLITQDQKICLMLTELPSLPKIRKQRKLSQFHVNHQQKRSSEIVFQPNITNIIDDQIISVSSSSNLQNPSSPMKKQFVQKQQTNKKITKDNLQIPFKQKSQLLQIQSQNFHSKSVQSYETQKYLKQIIDEKNQKIQQNLSNQNNYYNEDTMQEQLIEMQIFGALINLNNQRNQKINQKVLKKIPPDIVKNIQQRIQKRLQSKQQQKQKNRKEKDRNIQIQINEVQQGKKAEQIKRNNESEANVHQNSQ